MLLHAVSDEYSVDGMQFSDATLTTQSKYLNVTTSGNAVWDRKFRISWTVMQNDPIAPVD